MDGCGAGGRSTRMAWVSTIVFLSDSDESMSPAAGGRLEGARD